jgi:hypothetical protein
MMGREYNTHVAVLAVLSGDSRGPTRQWLYAQLVPRPVSHSLKYQMSDDVAGNRIMQE